MKAQILFHGELPPAFRQRLKNLAHRFEWSFSRLPAQTINIENDTDLVLLASWRQPPGTLQESARRIKESLPQIPLFLIAETSMDPQAQAGFSLESADGFLAINELEATLRDISSLETLEGLVEVPGVIINRKEQPLAGAPRVPKTRDLPEEHLKLSIQSGIDSEGYFPFLSALGCIERCHHCNIVSREGFRRGLNQKDLAEIASLIVKEHGIRKIRFLDHDFNASSEGLRLFAENLIEQQTNLDWKASFQFREFSDASLNLLQESGLKEAHFTLFSGSDRVLKRNNIGHTRAMITKTLQQFKAVGIAVHLKVYTGLPFETWPDTWRTLDLLETILPLVQGVTEVQPIRVEPNSLLARQHEKHQIRLNPADFGAWVREERDHLNDAPTRERKVAGIEQLAKRLDKLVHEPRYEASTGQQLLHHHAEWKASRRDIALITCPPWGYLNPPVGIAKLASYIKHKGLTCEVFDYNLGLFLKYPDFQRLWHVENKSYWSADLTFDVIRSIYDQDIEEAIDAILDVNADVYGFSAVDPKERMTIEFIDRLREYNSESRVILGGPVCGTNEYRNLFYDKLGHTGVDTYVVGEGEDTLVDLLQRARDHQSWDQVPGTCTVDSEGNWTFAPARPKVDLWNAPITTYEEFDLSLYECQELIVEWSRGCIGTCSFCKAKVLDGKFRSYSPEHVVNSLRYYVDNYNITKFTICDLAVNGNWKLLDKICDAIIESGLKVELRAQGIPRRQMKLHLLQKMKKAGFAEMQWGLETGSDKVLKAMDKDWMFTIEQAQEVIRNCHLAEIKTCMFCMVGYPTETEEDFQMTYDFIDRNAEYMDMVKSVNSLHIITDTPIHHRAEEFGITLPERDYHYKWEMEGNTHEIRQERVRLLLDLIKNKNIECLETNYLEGRQYEMIKDYKEEFVPMEDRIARLRKDVNQLIDYRMNQQEEWESDDNPREDFLAENRDLLGVFHGRKAFTGPQTVEIDLSNNCNFNCVGCWCHCDHLQELKTPAQRRKHHLPLDTIQGLIKDLAELGTQTIQLAGPGEPFTHPDIMDIIRYIKGNGLELHIITNFSYIDHAVAQELMDLKVDSLTCSLWAGDEATFLKTHPNQNAEAFGRIRAVLAFFGDNKKYNIYPRIKIFNVISRLNADNVYQMVQLGREVKADCMEFTVVDTVEGKTDFLSLSLEDVQTIEEQFAKVSEEATYPDPPGRKHLQNLTREQMQEHYEIHGKFWQDMDIYEGFEYEPINKVMTCKAGLANERMEHDPHFQCANVFYWNPESCANCSHFNNCSIDKESHSIKTRFFSILGYGSFIRRARESVLQRSRKEGRAREVAKLDLLPPTPFVDTMPCTIGWSYSRITTGGEVIACCKGYNKPLGNLYKNHFKHIWNDHPMREFRYKAKTISKGDRYFEPIGCYKACDNVGHNMEVHKRLTALKPREREWLKEEAAKVDPA